MGIQYNLTPELRVKLKAPLGMLIRGSFSETMRTLKKFINKEKPVAIISVGDAVLKNLAENSLHPQLSIVDNRIMRRKIRPIKFATEKTVHIKNPRGSITDEAIKAIRDALRSGCRVKIVVDGEEDLLTLIAILYSQENALVVYGQPLEGIVVVKVTPEKKAEIAEILEAMEKCSKD